MASTGSGSLFGGGGGLGATTQAPNTSTSILGNSSTTQTFSGASLFGSKPQDQQQPAQSSLFPQSQAQSGSSQATQPAFFNSLLERGRKRPLSSMAQSNNFEDLPSLQLGLDDIRRKARELGSPRATDSQQHAPSNKA